MYPENIYHINIYQYMNLIELMKLYLKLYLEKMELQHITLQGQEHLAKQYTLK